MIMEREKRMSFVIIFKKNTKALSGFWLVNKGKGGREAKLSAPRGYRKIAMTRCILGLKAPNALEVGSTSMKRKSEKP